MFKRLFASLFGAPVVKKETNQRIKQLEMTMQIVFNEIVGAMRKEPRVAQLNDDELILGVAQILMEERMIKAQMQKQQRVANNADAEFTKVSKIETSDKKTRTYH